MDACTNGSLVGTIDIVFGFKCDKLCPAELMHGDSTTLCPSVDTTVAVLVVTEDVITFDDRKKTSCCEVDDVGTTTDPPFTMSGTTSPVPGCLIIITGG